MKACACRNDLQPQCRKEEQKISEVQARDVRLRPKLMKLCSEEMLLFCSNVKAGGGRMFTCLLENVQHPTFGTMCKAEVLKREDRAKDDYRLDAGVFQACKADIAQHCSQEETKASGHAEVLSCMVDRMMDPALQLAEECEKQMSRCAFLLSYVGNIF
jgi:golgi apparatus protein 1